MRCWYGNMALFWILVGAIKRNQFKTENLIKACQVSVPLQLTDAFLFEFSQGVRYYLNIDRCAYGGVIAVRSLLDGTPQVRGAEILAAKYVNSKCTEVYYNDDEVWKRYRSAINIHCKPWKRVNRFINA